jgi:Competence protein CoiA-like family
MEERKPTRAALSEARETGCVGLLSGTAKNLYTHKTIYADIAEKKNGPFYCAECNSDAVVRKCTEKADHFAHVARLSPDGGSVESKLHKQCKEEICSKLQERFSKGRWEKERQLKQCYKFEKKPRRPDISGFIGKQALVIEVQVMPANPINIADNFKKQFRNKFTPQNERKAIPFCNTWQDKLAHWWNKEDEQRFKDSFKEDFDNED